MINIHPLADVQSKIIGEGTVIWQFCVILPNARIGSNCNICAYVFIENDVVLGSGVTVKSGVQLWDGIRIGNKVFVGPNVTFTNDLIPRSKSLDWKMLRTDIEEGVSIGANATIIGGITIGCYALIGAGSVVTKDIPAYTVWYGNPAKQKGYITKTGKILDLDKKDEHGVVHQIEEK